MGCLANAIRLRLDTGTTAAAPSTMRPIPAKRAVLKVSPRKGQAEKAAKTGTICPNDERVSGLMHEAPVLPALLH